MAQDFTVDRNSPKRVLHSDGYLKTYAVDEPAFEFKDDGSYRGVLIEPSATNVALQSEDMATTWSAFEVTVQSNDTTAPDNSTTADEIIPSAVSDAHQVSQVITLTDSTTYTMSVFAKANGYNFVRLGVTIKDGTFIAGYFDLSSGSVETVSVDGTGAIEAYPNGWYRVSLSYDSATGASTTTHRIMVNSADNQLAWSGDATNGIFVWGAQVEEGPIATSYIKTTNEPLGVTRNADDINLTGASSLIGQTEGTLFVEVDWRATSGKSQILLEVSGAPLNNRIFIYNVSLGELRMRAEANNVTVTDQGASSTGFSNEQKIAFAYAENDFVLYRNGSSISSDTSGSLAALATLTDVDLGQSVTSTFQANMWIKSVALFTRRLTNTELAALTS